MDFFLIAAQEILYRYYWKEKEGILLYCKPVSENDLTSFRFLSWERFHSHGEGEREQEIIAAVKYDLPHAVRNMRSPF